MEEALDCIVTIPNGTLRGAKGKSIYSDVSYYKFCGIPYAQPPVGPLRFRVSFRLSYLNFYKY